MAGSRSGAKRPAAQPVQAEPSRRQGAGSGSAARARRLALTLMKTMVPVVGLEPTLLAEQDFESSASTNFTTPARRLRICGDEAAASTQ